MGHNKNTIPESGSSVPESHNESFRAEFSFPLRCFSPPLGQVVSCLLLFMEEEDALWMMCALIEDLLPPSVLKYSHSPAGGWVIMCMST